MCLTPRVVASQGGMEKKVESSPVKLERKLYLGTI